MQLHRRKLLKVLGLAGSAIPLAGCERIISSITKELGQAIPEKVGVTDGALIDPDFHLLARATYGAWPGELDRLKATGRRAWIEEQLNPDSIDDTLCNLRARRFETLYHEPGTCYEYKKPVLREEIARHTLLRAVYSKRQLFEVMAGFWTDHLNINIEKGDCIYLKPSDDRLVIRGHALGRFKDLIRASATSPAMLVYLDGKENRRSSPSDVPNENYARELLELHTLGVHGGYTQKDVYEIARCLTGWRLHTTWQKGIVYFDPTMHDDGEKKVLGQRIQPGGGPRDLDQVIDIVCRHPSTAVHIATKLVRKFVADDPPRSLVDRVAADFSEHEGEIKPLLRRILMSDEFGSARGAKLKRPFHFVVSSLRAVGADTHAHQPLIEYLTRMGQGLFQHPTPDGYPDASQPWLGTLLWRWNFALALASNEVPATRAPLDDLERAVADGESGLSAQRLMSYFIGRACTSSERQSLEEYVSIIGEDESKYRAELAGLILASPAFQMH